MIELINLSKTYGAKQALSNVTLSLAHGKVHGIVGENGAGKTTLFRCIAGLESYDGEIKWAKEKHQIHIGYLPTSPFFFDKITGEEYLRLMTDARSIKLKHVADHNLFNLPLNRYASQYSTGMKKKLAIHAILLQKNDLYLFDEPFNGVDIESNQMIIEVIHRLKKLGKTVIVSSHIFSTLFEISDHIFHFSEGTCQRKYERTQFEELELEMKKGDFWDRLASFEF